MSRVVPGAGTGAPGTGAPGTGAPFADVVVTFVEVLSNAELVAKLVLELTDSAM